MATQSTPDARIYHPQARNIKKQVEDPPHRVVRGSLADPKFGDEPTRPQQSTASKTDLILKTYETCRAAPREVSSVAPLFRASVDESGLSGASWRPIIGKVPNFGANANYETLNSTTGFRHWPSSAHYRVARVVAHTSRENQPNSSG